MSLSRNLLAGLASSVWTALIGLAVVPLYLKYLGIEAYGLIGFFATMQAMLSLLDMGLAPTINREVARHSETGNLPESGRLLHTLAVVYWSLAAGIALLIFALAPLITEHWLQSKHLPPQTIQHAVILMGFVAACRWPVGLYQGALMGAQRMTVVSTVSAVMATFTSLGGVAILAFVSPTIEAFFMWQAGVGLLNALTMRFAAWRIIGRIKLLHFDVNALKQIWRFSVGMSGVAILSIILMQLDKILLSRMLSLEDFGRYALAGVVANGLYLLLSPVFNVLYPRLSVLVVTGNTKQLIGLYCSGTRLLASCLFPLVMAVTISVEDLVFLWTGDNALALNVSPIIRLLLLGTALNGIMHFPYALQLAFGMTHIPMVITSFLTITLVPIIIYLTWLYGPVGGGLAWLILNILYLIFGTWLTHRYLLKGIALTWLIRDVGLPLCISFIVVIGGYQLLNITEFGVSFLNILIIGCLALIAFSVCMILLFNKKVKRVWYLRFVK